MTDTTSTTEAVDSTVTEVVDNLVATPEKGSWQEALQRSTSLKDRAGKANKQAGALLWTGAQAAVEDWLPEAGTDASGERIAGDVLTYLGKSRKGDASKIKSVALAVRDNGLLLAHYPNLSQAYKAALDLTVTAKRHEDEDSAADEVVQKIAADAPKSTQTPEGATKITLSQGLDEWARLVVNELVGEGPQEDLSAARAALRALSQEVAGRVPKPAPKVKAAPKAKAGTKTKAEVKDGAAKAKAAPAKTTKAKPVQRKKPVEQAEPEVEADDMFEDETDAVEPVEVMEVPVKKAAPVKRPAVKGRPAVRRG